MSVAFIKSSVPGILKLRQLLQRGTKSTEIPATTPTQPQEFQSDFFAGSSIGGMLDNQ